MLILPCQFKHHRVCCRSLLIPSSSWSLLNVKNNKWWKICSRRVETTYFSRDLQSSYDHLGREHSKQIIFGNRKVRKDKFLFPKPNVLLITFGSSPKLTINLLLQFNFSFWQASTILQYSTSSTIEFVHWQDTFSFLLSSHNHSYCFVEKKLIRRQKYGGRRKYFYNLTLALHSWRLVSYD